MKSVDTGKEKVKKICEVLRKETLDPAKKEGDLIIAKARADAEKIIKDAKNEASKIHDEAKRRIEEERNVFQASMNLAAKKSIDTLKQEIEKNLFNPELSQLIADKMKEPKIVAELIQAIVTGIEKEGIEGDLKAIVSSAVGVDAVNKELTKGIIEKLKSKSVEIGEIEGGAQIKIIDQNLTIDMSDEALKGLLASFVRDDFRSVIFATTV
ncbi:MAG: DivIVA domain-containing protein [Chlamydiales bacterium]|nr:DivIVA domain-containing protein [Chlamydiia bacterium]MCP5504278.1 DivIVA domain-containing protein [Chlamydiales bacterium]